jgi:hypothetical protein
LVDVDKPYVLSAAVNQKEKFITLTVAVDTRPDFVLALSESPKFSGGDDLSFDDLWRLTAADKNSNAFQVHVLSRATGEMVPGVSVQLFHNGEFLKENETNARGVASFRVKLPEAGTLLAWVEKIGKPSKLVMVGSRQITVVDRGSKREFLTQTDRFLTRPNRTAPWEGNIRANTLAQSSTDWPGNLGYGVVKPPSGLPAITGIPAQLFGRDPAGKTVAVAVNHTGITFTGKSANVAVTMTDDGIKIGSESFWAASRVTRSLGGPDRRLSALPPSVFQCRWASFLSNVWLIHYRIALAIPYGHVFADVQASAITQALADQLCPGVRMPQIVPTIVTHSANLASSGALATGGNVIATGGGNVIASGGGNVIASGGGNVIASGGGNVIASGGGNVIASGGGNVIASGGGNVIASGGGNIIASGGGNVIATGGGNAMPTFNAFRG